MPRSPWLASAGWTKCAGVPVLARVAAILRAMWPDLPMPRDDHPPLGRQQDRRRRRQSLSPRPSASTLQRLGLFADHAAGGGEVGGRTVGHVSARRCRFRASPSRSSRARVGRKSKQACASSVRPSRASMRVELVLQPVQVKHVGGRVVELRRRSGRRRPSRFAAAAWRCRCRPDPAAGTSARAGRCRCAPAWRRSWCSRPAPPARRRRCSRAAMSKRPKWNSLSTSGSVQHPGEVRRLGLALGDLHQVAMPVAARHLDQAQPVAVRVQAHRLAVDCDDRAEVEPVGQVALVEMVRHLPDVLLPALPDKDPAPRVQLPLAAGPGIHPGGICVFTSARARATKIVLRSGRLSVRLKGNAVRRPRRQIRDCPRNCKRRARPAHATGAPCAAGRSGPSDDPQVRRPAEVITLSGRGGRHGQRTLPSW